MTSGTGTCSVIANQAGNSSYAAAPQVTDTVTATPLGQTITFTIQAPASAANGSNFTVAATASSGLTVAYTSSGSCSNAGATYTMTSGTGTCSVIANQAGNANYAAAPRVTETVNAASGSQTITFTTPAPTSAANGSNFTVAATASSGLTVAYTSSGSCSNSGATYTMTSAPEPARSSPINRATAITRLRRRSPRLSLRLRAVRPSRSRHWLRTAPPMAATSPSPPPPVQV